MTDVDRANNSPNTKKIRQMGIAALACALLALTVSLVADSTLFAFVANGVLVAYALSSIWLIKRNATIASQMAENIYFLGYLLTITGLCMLAYEIGHDQHMLDSDRIKEVLTRGGNAVVSTLIGLVGMNVVKAHAQSLDLQKEEESDVVERILTQFAERLEKSQTNQGKELLEIFQASQLSENMKSLASQLEAGSKSMETLRETSTQANGTLNNLAGHMSAIELSAKEFAETIGTICEDWKQISSNVQQAAGLNLEIATLTSGMKELHVAAGSASQNTQKFSADINNHHLVLVETLEKIHKRTIEIVSLSSAVNEFVVAANTIAPTLKTINESFREVGHVNQNLEALTAGLQNFNYALDSGGRGMVNMNHISTELGSGIGTLVAGLKIEVHALTTLSEPLRKFAELSKEISPVLDSTKGDIKHLVEFTQNITRLHASATELENAIKTVKVEMDETGQAVHNFVSVITQDINRLKSR